MNKVIGKHIAVDGKTSGSIYQQSVHKEYYILCNIDYKWVAISLVDGKNWYPLSENVDDAINGLELVSSHATIIIT